MIRFSCLKHYRMRMTNRITDAIAFMSYAHFDDTHDERFLTELRKYLSSEVRVQTGDEFRIFQDREDIKWGQLWQERIEDSLSGITFLILILTCPYRKYHPPFDYLYLQLLAIGSLL